MVAAYSLASTTIGGAIHTIPASPALVSTEALGAANDARATGETASTMGIQTGSAGRDARG